MRTRGTKHIKYITEPRYELGQQLTRIWHSQTGLPLSIVAGTQELAESVSFYSKDHPSTFIAFDFHDAPWITPERITRQGFAIVCDPADPICIGLGKKYTRCWSDISIARKSLLGTALSFTYLIALVPPFSPSDTSPVNE